MLTKIKCPKCNTDGTLSLLDPNYEGPYKCWKCREFFKIKLENHRLMSCDPLSQEEHARLQEILALKSKFKK